jgi:hypothetical protein
MSEIVKLVIAVIGIVSLASSIPFYFALTSGVIRISQGDLNATQDIIESTTDEVVSTLMWNVAIYVGIAIASALGLGFLVAFLKKLS